MVALPPGLHPSEVVNPHDHGAILTVVAAYCITVALIFFCGRLSVRWPWWSRCGKDDVAVAIASLLGVVQVIFICTAVSAGLGKIPGEISSAQLRTVDKYLYISNILYTMITSLGRLSVIFLQKRLSGPASHRKLISYLTVSCAVFWVVSFLLLAVPSGDVAPWLQVDARYSTIGGRWAAVETLGSLLDILIVLYIVHLVWDMQASREKKRLVVILFALRLPLVGIAIARICNIYSTLNGTAVNFRYITTEIYTQVSICYNLISATTPVLRIFLRAARSGIHGTVAGDSLTEVDPVDAGGRRSIPTMHPSHLSSKLSSSLQRHLTGSSSRAAREDEEDLAIELTSRGHGETITTAVGGRDDISVATYGSEEGIVVRQKVDVTFDPLQT